MNVAAEEPDDRQYDSLAPGDLFIDNTTRTLFQVMIYQQDGCTPSQIVEGLGITYDQVLAALDYIEQHRSEVEAAFQADSRAIAQRFIHTLIGSYQPAWIDRTIPLGGIGVGILSSIMGFNVARQFITSSTINQDIFTILIHIVIILFCGIVSICMIVFGIRLLIDSFSLHYTITDTLITATRYGRLAEYSIPVNSIIEAYPTGQFLDIVCENGETYQILGLKQLREAANNIPAKEANT